MLFEFHILCHAAFLLRDEALERKFINSIWISCKVADSMADSFYSKASSNVFTKTVRVLRR